MRSLSGSVNGTSGKLAALAPVVFSSGEFGFAWRNVVLVP